MKYTPAIDIHILEFYTEKKGAKQQIFVVTKISRTDIYMKVVVTNFRSRPWANSYENIVEEFVILFRSWWR
jgi:hypothetical protein